MKNKLMKRLRNYLITGMIILLPLVVTLYVLWTGFNIVDGLLGGLIARLLRREIPGAGTLVTLFLTILVGAVATNIIGKRLITFGENILARIPVVRSIYSTVKQVIDAFAVQNRDAFKRVVMIEYPRRGLYSIGFVTGEGLGEILGSRVTEELLTVFIPTAPNPTTGFFVLLPRQEVIPLEMTVEEGLKLVISGGVIIPNRLGRKNGFKNGGPEQANLTSQAVSISGQLSGKEKAILQ
ncbi:MAG: DUF502 domain-containing protein [Syntrophothermus sp.]